MTVAVLPDTATQPKRRLPTSLHGLHSALLAAALGLLLHACSSSAPEPPANAPATELRAWAAGRLAAGELDRAIVGYRRALQLDSLDAAAMAGLADVYDLQERTEPAERYRNRAFHVHYARGDAFAANGQADSARAAFVAALSIMPTHPMGHLRLGRLSHAAGQLDSAIAHFEDAVEADPRFGEALVALAQAYVEAGRNDEAQGLFQRALERNINNVDAYAGLGALYAQRGDWARAAVQYERILLIDPQSESARSGLERARSGLQGR